MTRVEKAGLLMYSANARFAGLKALLRLFQNPLKGFFGGRNNAFQGKREGVFPQFPGRVSLKFRGYAFPPLIVRLQ
ncbi:MAG: hypothetical protein LBC51_02500 [Treponema sp.]|jgi:hypothetical protein|nr:hypothetical protein [Treponema sp.]